MINATKVVVIVLGGQVPGFLICTTNIILAYLVKEPIIYHVSFCVSFLVGLHSEPPAGEEGGSGEAPAGGSDADLQSNWDETIETFDGMDLPEELLRGIYSYGFEKPSAIQQRAIKPTILGKDLIAQAQSGTVSLT